MSESVLNITANSIAALTECHDVHHYRTVAGIVQSCATTIILCVWAVLHLNVPDSDVPKWKRVFHRITCVIETLIAPEAIFGFAFEDWIKSSGFLKKLIRERPTCKWTETHAMFARMGGFRLIDKGGSKTHLMGEAFFTRVSCGEIDIPKVTTEEILDKSKGDWVAKAIVLVQTVWFALQILNRYAQRLPVTELEITTLAHVTLNVFIYWCWWNKPLNVTTPIDILARSSKRDVTVQTSEYSGEGSVDIIEQNESKNLGETYKERLLEDEEAQTTQPPMSVRARMGAWFAGADGNEIWNRFGPIAAIISGIFGGIHCLAWYSTFHTRLESILWRSCASVVAILPFISLFLASVFTMPPNFDMSKLKKKGRVTAIVGFIVAFSVSNFVLLVVFSYVFARICLLVLALLALRTVPEKALLIPSWTQYIPHV